MNDFVEVPGTAHRVFVHKAAGLRSTRVLALVAASASARVVEMSALGAGLRLGGARLLPRVQRLPRWPNCDADELGRALRSVIRGFILHGVVLPRQGSRQTISVSGSAMGVPVVAKLGSDAESIRREAEVLMRLTAAPIPAISTARLLEHGPVNVSGARAYAVVTEHADGHQRPEWSSRQLRLFGRHLGDRLCDIERPDGTPPSWLPSHGDLAPWNLRRTHRGLALFDWAGCTFAPRETDLAYFGLCVAAMGRGPVPAMSLESQQFLANLLASRSQGASALDELMTTMLRHVQLEVASCAS